MNIVHVIHSLDPAQGGPPVTASRLASAQAALGHAVCVVSYGDTNDATIRRTLACVPGVGRVAFDFVSSRGVFERVMGGSARQVIRAHCRDADLVHLHGVWDTIVRVGALTARSCGVPYVITPHGMLDPWSMRQKAMKKRVALACVYRRILADAAFLHVLSESEAELLAPLAGKTPRSVIPNGIFLEEIDGPQPSSFETIEGGKRRGGPFILFLSRLHYKKGLDLLADAFALFCKVDSNATMVVAGPDCGAKTGFEASIARHGLAERVQVIGPVYGAAKVALLRAASCFCLPSRQEGFSIAILEALASSVPVVITENCHFPEVARCGAGLVTPLSATSIADALVAVMGDEAGREQMARAGRRLVENGYTWERVADRCLSSYREMLRA